MRICEYRQEKQDMTIPVTAEKKAMLVDQRMAQRFGVALLRLSAQTSRFVGKR